MHPQCVRRAPEALRLHQFELDERTGPVGRRARARGSLGASVQLDRKLAEWQKAGILSAEDAARILAYEGHEARPYLLYAVGGLGALTIALGVVAIIASNWEAIPGGIKLAIDIGLAIGLAAGILAVDRRRIDWLRETLIALYWGYVLASIGLISQVYHLGGATWQALLVWTGLTFPLVTRGHSGGLASLWVLALHATYFMVLERITRTGRPSEGLLIGLVGLAPLLCLAVASSAAVERARPQFHHAFAGLGWCEALAMTSLATFAFLEAPLRPDTLQGFWIATGIAAVLIAYLVARADRLVDHPGAVLPLRVLLVMLLVLGYGPILLAQRGMNLVGALAFIALWAVVAWVGYASHNARILNLATAIIGIRLIVVYFEVFGSLLDTGLGLVTGGLLTVALTYFWARKRREIAGRFSEEHSP